jgi:hypothetical protein
MITVFSTDPSFGNAAELVLALQANTTQPVQSIFKQKDPKGFHNLVPDAIYDYDKALLEDRSAKRHWIIVAGESYAELRNHYLWSNRPERVSVVLTDSYYVNNHDRLNEEMLLDNIEVHAMLDLIQYRDNLPTTVFWQPFNNLTEPARTFNGFCQPHKAPALTICHSPSFKYKSDKKGSKCIAQAVANIQNGSSLVDYLLLTDLPWQEAIKAKSISHIFIDQMVDRPEYTGGLGKSGLEAMLLGCLTITSGVSKDADNHTATNPPVIRSTPQNLEETLRQWISASPIVFSARISAQRNWAEKHTSYKTVADNLLNPTK